eukprot:c2448_g1_i1.p1 GENE.c2448_g1_i1~~c2448_g1_i1.p1  ORF type:complete len:185 (-),score=31.28 c2448_g1_i1:56-610(-)
MIPSHQQYNTTEEQFVPVDKQVPRTEARDRYMQYMDLVDKTNQDVLASLVTFKEVQLDHCQYVWVLVVVVCVNARRMHQSACGVGHLFVADWQLKVSPIKVLAAQAQEEPQDRFLKESSQSKLCGLVQPSSTSTFFGICFVAGDRNVLNRHKVHQIPFTSRTKQGKICQYRQFKNITEVCAGFC